VRAVALPLSRKSLALILPLLVACAGVHPGSGFVGATDDRTSDATTPHITLLEQPPRADRVVDAAFQVDADAYALVLAVDLDQQVHVVFPDSPMADGLVSSREQHLVTPFYAGSGRGAISPVLFERDYSGYGYGRSYYPYGGYGRSYFPYQSGYGYGTGLSRYRAAVYLVAIASARPLQLDRLRDPDGSWSAGTLHSLVFESSPGFVGSRLGQLVTSRDQEFSTDYRVIVGGSSPLYARSGYGYGGYGNCGMGAYGAGYANRYDGAPTFGLDAYAPRGMWFVADLGSGGPLYTVTPITSACGARYLYDAPGLRIRRPSELFPNDTSLLFTTRRTALRMPGSGGIGTPHIFPGTGEPGSIGPDLTRGGTTSPRAGERTAAPPAPAPRTESRGGGERPRASSAPSRTGHRQ
jgi:hypothetical protein